MTVLLNNIEHDPDVELRVPESDVADPEVTFLIPAANEELTIGETVDWCLEGLRTAEVSGEILIVDSSTDRTAEIALAHGARVLKTPKRGLGRAYIDAIPFVRGRYIIMGDADATYDFRGLRPFVEEMRKGYDFVMGSRWKGTIAPGAMPASHQYFGSPLTTWIFNRIYGSRFSDIHCGMRAVTRDALQQMGLTSQSWEYASEMILKSVRMGLRTTEVPVNFHKDREGRVSHYKRAGRFTNVQAAWISLRIQLVYRAEFISLKPGLVAAAIGLLFTLPLSFGPITIGSVTFSLYWMLLGVLLTILGLQSFFFGCLAQVFCDHSGRARARWTEFFRYTRTALVSAGSFLIGLGLTVALIARWLTHGYKLAAPNSMLEHLAVTGVLLMIIGFSLFCFTLVLHATGVRYGVDDKR